MRIQLATISLFLSLAVSAKDEKSMQDLFKKYDSVMDLKKTELVEEVFSQKFIKESGGKSELVSKIKGLDVDTRSIPKTHLSWKKGLKGGLYLAKIKSTERTKKDSHETEFIVIEENGKLKIDGTLSDGD